ncbi:C-type lectin domain family 2 member D-like isoform X2 [Carettochelys insculpta]|uniref:C-type lectin domain family 2 member D-like isoform X2 n=1 Tax=Carettochelys insculpta TaxID=44489 RepID=UPI003EBE7114
MCVQESFPEVIRKQPLAASGCPDGWFRNRGKCYYFSKDELSWNDSQSFCLSCAASLAGIGRQQELDSELPYRGSLDHWIGLQRDTGGIWRWINGTKFDHPSEIQGGADCAYLDEDLNINSSGCSTQRKWVCSKPDTPQ